MSNETEKPLSVSELREALDHAMTRMERFVLDRALETLKLL